MVEGIIDQQGRACVAGNPNRTDVLNKYQSLIGRNNEGSLNVETLPAISGSRGQPPGGAPESDLRGVVRGGASPVRHPDQASTRAFGQGG